MDPLATPDDVAARWRPLSAAEELTAETLCSDASALLRARFPGIDGQVTAGTMDADILTMVCAQMVKAAMAGNTDGISQQSEGLPGGFTRSQSFANPLGNVFITAAQLTLILGYQPAGQSKRFGNTTIRCSPYDLPVSYS